MTEKRTGILLGKQPGVPPPHLAISTCAMLVLVHRAGKHVGEHGRII